MIQAVAMGAQWCRPMKSHINYGFLPCCVNESDRRYKKEDLNFQELTIGGSITENTLETPTAINELHVGTHVCLAAFASHWAQFT